MDLNLKKMTQLEIEIIDFFKLSTALKNINLDTNLGSEKYEIFDLDAEILMESFFKKYDIDYSNFMIDKYFIYPDYSWKSLFFFRAFFKKVEYPVKPALRIKHLIEVAKRKEWFEPS